MISTLHSMGLLATFSVVALGFTGCAGSDPTVPGLRFDAGVTRDGSGNAGGSGGVGGMGGTGATGGMNGTGATGGMGGSIGMPAQCGDGNIDLGEGCDDGNSNDGDGCAADCTVEARCGDGTVDMGEGCDDGNSNDGDGCSATCSVEASCGDGSMDAGEGCDDGNNLNGDGCSANCMVEPRCGDGNVDAGETCDDANNLDGDGCSAQCQREARCGDGNVDGGEGCDDGNNEDGDGCSAACVTEPRCGDGNRDAPEACDDGNNVDGDGCSANCTVENDPNALAEGQIACIGLVECANLCEDDACVNACIENAPQAGQDRWNAVAQCIQDNMCVGADGRVDQACLDNNCAEVMTACFGGDPIPAGVGSCSELLDCASQCDGQVCTRRCIAAASQESLDTALAVNQCVFTDNQCAGRESDCALDNCPVEMTACYGEAICGNGRREVGEACDDANVDPGDGCSPECVVEVEPGCGDGNADVGEGCDDGNNLDGDGCSAVCTIEEPNVLDAGQIACLGIQDCLDRCPDADVNCRNDCLANAPPEGQIRLAELRQCIQVNNCFNADGSLNRECTDAQCAAALEGCLGGEVVAAGQGTCAELIECAEVCQDRVCVRDCIGAASQEGYDAGAAFDRCVLTDNDCPSRDSDCAIDNCGAQLTACFGDAVCGNGRREVGEACDDGNGVDDDECRNECILAPSCGDGNVDRGEQCDDGNLDGGDGCAADCTEENPNDLDAGQLACLGIQDCIDRCPAGDQACADACVANGLAEGQQRLQDLATCARNNECIAADGSADSDCLDANCLAEVEGCIGNQPVEARGDANCDQVITCVEACEGRACVRGCLDAAGQAGFDAARNLDTCIFTDNQCGGRENDCALNNCGDLITICFGPPVCGDSRRGPGEACDDGNVAAGDGCSADCQIEPRCGDGNVDAGEECDDNNTLDGDGCAANCTHEALPCMDDNFEDNDTADTATPIENQAFEGLQICAGDEDWYEIPVCAGGTVTALIFFTHADGDLDMNLYGDNLALLDQVESETDNEEVSWQNQGGDSVVRVEVYGFEGAENTYAIAYRVVDCVVAPACGDGNIDAGEECDDSNNVDGDGCSANCTTEVPPCVDDNFEENDAADAATPLDNNAVDGLQICSQDDDWYEIRVCPGGTLDLRVVFNHANGDIDVELLSVAGESLDSGVSTTNDEIVSWVNPGASAIVRAQVLGFNGTENNYAISYRLSNCPAEGAVRIVDGASATQGRVEVYASREWGTICDDFWSIEDAHVVCRQLGYPGALEAVQQVGGGQGAIHLDDVQCTGDEVNLLDCPASALGDHNCVHDEDAGIVCQDIPAPPVCGDGNVDAGEDCDDANNIDGDGCSADCSNEILPCVDDAFEENDAADAAVRIQPGQFRMQICPDDEDWYTMEVCAGGNLSIELLFSHADGDVDLSLRSFNGDRLASSVTASDNERAAWLNGDAAARTVRWRVYGFQGAENAYGMIVNLDGCDPAEGDVRLADGDVASSGRVEIFAGGQWGTVCDDFWALNAADIVCRQLGFLGALEAVSRFGGGVELPIVLDNVQCNGGEGSLLECDHNAINDHDCVSAENAGVICIERLLPIR